MAVSGSTQRKEVHRTCPGMGRIQPEQNVERFGMFSVARQRESPGPLDTLGRLVWCQQPNSLRPANQRGPQESQICEGVQVIALDLAAHRLQMIGSHVESETSKLAKCGVGPICVVCIELAARPRDELPGRPAPAVKIAPGAADAIESLVFGHRHGRVIDSSFCVDEEAVGINRVASHTSAHDFDEPVHATSNIDNRAQPRLLRRVAVALLVRKHLIGQAHRCELPQVPSRITLTPILDPLIQLSSSRGCSDCATGVVVATLR